MNPTHDTVPFAHSGETFSSKFGPGPISVGFASGLPERNDPLPGIANRWMARAGRPRRAETAYDRFIPVAGSVSSVTGRQ